MNYMNYRRTILSFHCHNLRLLKGHNRPRFQPQPFFESFAPHESTVKVHHGFLCVWMIHLFSALHLHRSIFVFLHVRVIFDSIHQIYQMEHSGHLRLTECFGCRNPSRTPCFVRRTPNQEHQQAAVACKHKSHRYSFEVS